jgi:biotin operon repressor
MKELKTSQDIGTWIIKWESSHAESTNVLDRRFRAGYIADEFGMSNQSVLYHLNQLADKGILLKVDRWYQLVDTPALIDLMLAKQLSNKNLNRGYDTRIWSGAKSIKEFVNLITNARALKLIDSVEARQYMLDQIDETIAQLKRERRYLVDKEFSPGTVRKYVHQFNPKEAWFWDEVGKKMEVTETGHEGWYSYFQEVMKLIGFEFPTPLSMREKNFAGATKEED